MRFTQKQAKDLIISRKLEDLSPAEMLALFHENESLRQFLPGNKVNRDQRTGDITAFNPSRAARPRHKGKSSGCPICEGKSTPIIDVEELSDGFAFINQNLYPAVYPHSKSSTYDQDQQISGMHFVQWTTSVHENGWDNMPANDLEIGFKQLGRLERYLLESNFKEDFIGKDRSISIIKNAGALSGGSIAHDHQQVIVSDVVPARIQQNLRYFQENGITFSQSLLDQADPELIVADLGEAVLLVPPFMRRPYNLSLVIINPQIQYIHQLSSSEISSVVAGWKQAIQSINEIMPQIGKQISYNVLTHNGPGAGLYFEFLPHSQPNGGFERLGLSICQASPQMCAEKYRQVVANL